MRDGIILINASRSGITDEDGLVARLQSGKVGAAGIDVFAHEPVPGDHPRLQFDQILLMAHIGGLTQDGAERMAVSLAKNIPDFFCGTLDHTLIVNKEHANVALKA